MFTNVNKNMGIVGQGIYQNLAELVTTTINHAPPSTLLGDTGFKKDSRYWFYRDGFCPSTGEGWGVSDEIIEKGLELLIKNEYIRVTIDPNGVEAYTLW